MSENVNRKAKPTQREIFQKLAEATIDLPNREAAEKLKAIKGTALPLIVKDLRDLLEDKRQKQSRGGTEGAARKFKFDGLKATYKRARDLRQDGWPVKHVAAEIRKSIRQTSRILNHRTRG